MSQQKRVLITDYAWPTIDIEREILTKARAEVLTASTGEQNELIDLAPPVHAILANWRPLRAPVIEVAGQCQIICRYGVGVDNIDVEAATEHGIVVTNVPDYCMDEVSTEAMALVLCAARRILHYDRSVRTGAWDVKLGMPLFRLKGLTLGIIGFGRIGKGVARRAKGFDMRVIYTDVQRVDEATEREYGVMYVDKRTLLRESDFVSLHIPLFAETQHFLSDPEFALMKKTAILVNAARGPIVDEKALVRALKEAKIAGAGLDVYEKEPKCERALLSMKNVVLAPHTASGSIETRTKMAMMAAQNCAAGLTGQRPPNIVNPEILAR